MNSSRPTPTAAYTLIEMLTVIAIIAIVAGLVVGLNNVAGDKSKVSRAQVERDRLVTLIEAYKLKTGVYPPANTNDPGKNTLAYELMGAVRNSANPADPSFTIPFGITIKSSEMMAEFGVAGIINASDDRTEIKRLLKNIKPDQYVATGVVLRLVIPVNDPNGNRPNYWNYLVGTDDDAKKIMKNPDSFDLWVNIKTRGQRTNTIGNWKD